MHLTVSILFISKIYAAFGGGKKIFTIFKAIVLKFKKSRAIMFAEKENICALDAPRRIYIKIRRLNFQA